MDVPLGHMVGNSLEVIESLETLKGRGPAHLEALSVRLAARMLLLGGGAATYAEAETRIRDALTSGRGVEKFRAIVAQQGGDPRVIDDYRTLPAAPKRVVFQAERSGHVTDHHAELLGRAAMVLGAGRERADAGIHHAVGLRILAHRGEQVKAGDALIEIHYHDEARLPAALELIDRASVLDDAPPPAQELVLETLE
jgi:thymidine phosphorylase